MITEVTMALTDLGLVRGRRRSAVEPVVGLHAAVQAEGAPVAGAGNDILGRLVGRLGHPLQLNFSAGEGMGAGETSKSNHLVART